MNRLIATRSPEVVTDADRMFTFSSASTRVTSDSSRCRSSASTWMATRNTDDGDGAQSTSMMRSACCCSDAALVQSVRCTLTPPPRVTNPRIWSPGTGVQHLASLVSTPGAPGTETPTSSLLRGRRSMVVGVDRSASSSSAWSMPPSSASSRCTTCFADTCPSPIAV